jgi:hypothetical protein
MAAQAAMPTLLSRRLPPGRDALAIAVALAAGWAFGWWAWQRIVLPFENPLGIVGPLTLREFNPLNNILRYLVFVGAPPLLYAAILLVFGRPPARAAADGDARPLGGRTVALATAGLALAATTATGLRLLSRAFAIPPLDFFHAGEWLTPGFNYAEGHGLWTASLFIHGAFFDAVGTVAAWNLFGVRTIGAVDVFNQLLMLLVTPALVCAFVALALCASPGRRSPAVWTAAVVLALLVADVATFDTWQTLNRRDATVMLGVAALLFGVYWRRPLWLFVAGTCSAAAFFYAIDRGAYFTISAGLTLLLLAAREPRAFAGQMLAALAGFVAGWTVFFLAVGPTEFASFVETTRFFAATKDLLDSYVYPTPTFFPPTLHTLGPLCIAVQLVLTVRLALRGAPRETIAGQVLVALLALTYFRSALGRSDAGHVRYASFFAMTGVAYALCNLAGEAIARRPRVARGVAGGLAVALAVLTVTHWAPRIDAAKIAASPARLRALVAAPDDAFLRPVERRVRDRLRELTADDPCFFTYTSEGAWPYLVRKRTCGRNFIMWFASAAPIQEAVRRDLLEVWRPSHILLKSPGWPNAIDGIPNAKRMPALNEALTNAYQPVEEIDGFVIGRRVDPTPTR